MKQFLIILGLVVLAGAGTYFVLNLLTGSVSVNNEPPETSIGTSDEATSEDDSVNDADEDVEVEPVDETKTVIGQSVGGNDITAFHYGDGDTEVLFVGGIHAGYSWNTVLLAYELMDYLEEDESVIPDGVKVTIIPVMNPDGLKAVTGKLGRFDASDVPSTQAETILGRFNENGVDLNRNFDCEWEESATWQNRTVSGGDEAFSEPEANAVRGYIEARDPGGVVVWYSAAGGVFASSCRNGVLSETTELTKLYADASGYQSFEEFDFYEITGDMVNWLAKEGVPAISVLLTDYKNTEWSKNRAGIEAVLEFYAE